MPVDRRTAIADAAIRVVGREGVRGLTHRAVDRELAVPIGTTSNHARTRRDLLALVVARLAEGAVSDTSPDKAPPATVAEAVDLLTHLHELAVSRAAEARVRYALTLELVSDPELHEVHTLASPARQRLFDLASSVLDTLEIADVPHRAADLVALLNGLVFDSVSGADVRGRPADVRAILTAWFAGVAN